MTSPAIYAPSELDGEEAGGFVVVNLEAPLNNPYQVLEGDDGGCYATLEEARQACQHFREESGNERIYVYALIGVREALTLHEDAVPSS
ncbi:MAG: hypothetical protein WBD55_04275 [Dehalococcoidia bacterium]